ncbi:MAG: MBL fold metallo-hydrolase [Sphingobacterium sp.]|jgi:glyoxylase-like metal-dependent hydrolase (beta-lactamase superfamily II)|uniref:MBL fold metallo-hydrolase n=1 Tax=unclassified Sphingobacterium TaxID=2609468 RepID=UPI002842BE8D|nr:MBL fold metallo-hydrolase [Sphingobacterium sp.]MDR3009705.1 MBL fold metallo-hydrolase [Sphingobacterium sp.]
MLTIKTFTFNPYQENTYLLYNESGNAIIIDPGMYGEQDQEELTTFITDNGLKPTILLNTHCHIDHVLGNSFVHEKFGLLPQFHEDEVPILVAVQNYAPQMGFRYDISPIGETFLNDGDTVSLDNDELKVILAPGHSPAHICFYSADQKFLIGGDVLFRNSIGRTDLPGGNHQQLLDSIKAKLYTLPDDTVVYPGHGPSTTIGFEKNSNPFIRE